MDITVRQMADQAVFDLEGVVDERAADELKERFMELDTSILKEVVFDFAKVRHIGSAGIGKLLLFYKDMAEDGGVIRVENVQGPVYDLFKLLRLDTLFPISMNEEK